MMIFLWHFLISAILSVSAINVSTESHNATIAFDPCFLNNGECEQNCSKLESEDGNVTTQCACKPGFQLNEDLKSCNNETVTSVEAWLKIIGIDSAKVVLFLLSIFFGGFIFVFVITKLCFKKKSSEYALLSEKESAADIAAA